MSKASFAQRSRPPPAPKSNRSACSGSILIVSLWTLAILTSMGATIAAKAGARIQAVRHLTQRIQGREEAFGRVEEGIATFKERLKEPVVKERPAWEVETADFKIQDESRKISINAASVTVLTTLLTNLKGSENFLPEDLAAAITDWRDADEVALPKGTESDYYRSLSPAYSCRNGPFGSVEELLLVRGMTWELFLKMRDWVTVFGDGTVNLNTASLEVLKALGMSTGLAQKVESFDGQFSSVGAFPSELNAWTPLAPQEMAEASSMAGSGLLTTAARFYQIQVPLGAGADPWDRQIRCVVDSEGRIVAWHED